MKQSNIEKFHKRFANGEQYISLNPLGEIVDTYKTYYWEVREVYNRILPAVHMLKNKYPCITEKDIYGEKGLVSTLIPIQRAYNAVKNRKIEYLHRLVSRTLLVEDGSVDMDNLEEEGLPPGKILIYRQNAAQPQFLSENKLDIDPFDREEERLLSDFKNVILGFECFIKNKKGRNKNAN